MAQRKSTASETDTPLTTAKALHLFHKEMVSYGFSDDVINELVTFAGKAIVDQSGLGVTLDV